MRDNDLVSVRFMTETQMMDFLKEMRQGTEFFGKAMTVIHNKFQNVRFGGGYADSEMITVYWNIYDNKLFTDYKSRMAEQGRITTVLHAGIRLTLRILDGNKITFSSFLRQGIRKVSLGQKVVFVYDTEADLETFECSLLQMLSEYEGALTRLSDMTKRYVSRPLAVMEKIMKTSGISQKLRNKVISIFGNVNGDALCSYYDVYLAINELLYLAQIRHCSGRVQAELEEKVSECLQCDWEQLVAAVLDAA